MQLATWKGLYIQLCGHYRRKKSDEECLSYYDFLTYYNDNKIQDACRAIRRDNKYFPTPGEIETASKQVEGYHFRGETIECDYCDSSGFIRFQIKGKPYDYCMPCAMCRKISVLPQVVRKDESIWYATEKIKDKWKSNIYDLKQIIDSY